MPNETVLTNETRSKLEQLKEEKTFYAVDFSDEKYRAYRGHEERYNDYDKIEAEVSLTERLLNLPTTAEVSLTEEKRTYITLNLNRKKNFLLLNEKSRDNDSTEMKRVKETVGELEFHLQNEEFLNLKSISEISDYYDTAIEACKFYIANKNPWFSAGIKRKEKVQETLRSLRQERSLLLMGGELLRKGYIDTEKVKTPYDLIHSELTRYQTTQAEGIEHREGEDPELAAEIALAKKAGKDTSYLEWRQQTGHKEKVQRLVAERKAAGHECPERAAEVLDALTTAQGYFSREDIKTAKNTAEASGNLGGQEFARVVGALLYCPKFKDNNQPLNEKEQEKEQWNQKWIACFTEAQPLPAEVITQRKELMREGLKRVLDFPIPSPEEIREIGMFNYISRDPIRYRELVLNTLGLSGLEQLDPEVFHEVVPVGSAMEKKVEAMNALVSLGVQALKASPYYISEKASLGRHIFDLPEAEMSEEQKQEKKASDKGDILQSRDVYEQAYRDAMNADAMEKLGEGVSFDEASAQASRQLDTLQPLVNRMREQQLAGDDAIKVLSAAFYFVKMNANGEPLNAEEKRKADHNRKWIASWSRMLDLRAQTGSLENDMDVKRARRTIMSYYFRFMRDMARTPMPEGKEMYCTASARIFAERDPYTFLNLQHAADGMDPLRAMFGEEMQIVEHDIGGLTEFKNVAGELNTLLSCDPSECLTHLQSYQQNFKEMEKKQMAAMSRQAGAEDSVKFWVHRRIRKEVDRTPYLNAENIRKEIVRESQALEAEFKRENPNVKIDAIRGPMNVAIAMKELDQLPKDRVKKMILDFKITKDTTGNKLSEEKFQSVKESAELAIGKLLSIDPQELEGLTLQKIGADFKRYRAIHTLMGESELTFLSFYKNAMKKYPNACKYKESDIMQVDLLLNHYAPKASYMINAVMVAGQFYEKKPDSEADPELLLQLKTAEVEELYADPDLSGMISGIITVSGIEAQKYPQNDRLQQIQAAKEAIAAKKQEEEQKEQERLKNLQEQENLQIQGNRQEQENRQQNPEGESEGEKQENLQKKQENVIDGKNDLQQEDQKIVGKNDLQQEDQKIVGKNDLQQDDQKIVGKNDLQQENQKNDVKKELKQDKKIIEEEPKQEEAVFEGEPIYAPLQEEEMCKNTSEYWQKVEEYKKEYEDYAEEQLKLALQYKREMKEYNKRLEAVRYNESLDELKEVQDEEFQKLSTDTERQNRLFDEEKDAVAALFMNLMDKENQEETEGPVYGKLNKLIWEVFNYEEFISSAELQKPQEKLQRMIQVEVLNDYLKKKINAKSPEQRTVEENRFAAAVAIRRITEKINREYLRYQWDTSSKKDLQRIPDTLLEEIGKNMELLSGTNSPFSVIEAKRWKEMWNLSGKERREEAADKMKYLWQVAGQACDGLRAEAEKKNPMDAEERYEFLELSYNLMLETLHTVREAAGNKIIKVQYPREWRKMRIPKSVKALPPGDKPVLQELKEPELKIIQPAGSGEEDLPEDIARKRNRRDWIVYDTRLQFQNKHRKEIYDAYGEVTVQRPEYDRNFDGYTEKRKEELVQKHKENWASYNKAKEDYLEIAKQKIEEMKKTIDEGKNGGSIKMPPLSVRRPVFDEKITGDNRGYGDVTETNTARAKNLEEWDVYELKESIQNLIRELDEPYRTGISIYTERPEHAKGWDGMPKKRWEDNKDDDWRPMI